MNIMILQKMFQHLSGSDQEVAVTALTTEFERVFSRGFGARVSV